MRKTLLFKSALPVGTAVLYYVTLHFWDNPAELIFITVLATALAAFAGATISVTAFFTAFAAAVALTAGFVMPDTAAAVFIAVFAIVFAVLTAHITFVMEGLNPASPMSILVIHNLLWTGAFGIAAYSGVTIYGGIALFVAVVLPLFLLGYKTQKKRSIDMEQIAQGT